jgi:hypothetical protein
MPLSAKKHTHHTPDFDQFLAWISVSSFASLVISLLIIAFM